MIKCRAIAEQSVYVTASGDVVPCCFLPWKLSNNDPELKTLLDSPNFEKLVETWSSSKPYSTCFHMCDDGKTNNSDSMASFKKQWVIKNGD